MFRESTVFLFYAAIAAIVVALMTQSSIEAIIIIGVVLMILTMIQRKVI